MFSPQLSTNAVMSGHIETQFQLQLEGSISIVNAVYYANVSH